MPFRCDLLWVCGAAGGGLPSLETIPFTAPPRQGADTPEDFITGRASMQRGRVPATKRLLLSYQEIFGMERGAVFGRGSAGGEGDQCVF